MELVAEGFRQPVFVTAPPDDPRLFIVDQPGTIWVIDGGDPVLFLDISDRVLAEGERGLLGLAFPPDFATTGLFYVDYTDGNGDTNIAEFAVTADSGVADPDSERTVLEVSQPASNHNGGMIAFGPDGALWIGMGDGGRSNDAFGNGQDPDTLLGAMLRIQPSAGNGAEYQIPPDNPYVDGGGAPEVWAIGLRNPWRWSFDGTVLWIADVGQNTIEEIDTHDTTEGGGANFGWPIMEGGSCFQEKDCDRSGLIQPVADYTHAEGCSVSGGYVYRGGSIPSLDGQYFYGDYCGGWIRSLAIGADGAVAGREWFPSGEVGGLTSFGVDSSGELYVTSTSGEVWRLVAAGR